MLRWFGSLKIKESADGQNKTDGITDDPLATIGFNRQQKQIYSVSRINPLYSEDNKCQQFRSSSHVISKCAKLGHTSSQAIHSFSKKSTSSGYGGSQAGSSNYKDNLKLREDAVAILEQNGNYVKSIKVSMSDRSKKRLSRISSHISGSSATGTLTTIPEGRVDFTIPKPIWPKLDLQQETYDSLVDEAMLLYSDLNYKSGGDNIVEEKSIKDVLIELLNRINAPTQDTNSTVEEKLKSINKTILLSIEALKSSTEDEIKKLCLNMSNSKNVLSVLKAFGNFSGNSISGNSSEGSPEWISEKDHVTSSEAEDFYQIPSASSSSGFSDSLKQFDMNQLPVFVHEDLSNLPDKVKNAMIYGTLCRGNYKHPTEKYVDKGNCVNKPRKGLLQACNDNKPSVWEQYYGVTVIPDGIKVTYSSNPADVPIFPGGRPEADFTLDVPRSEFLAKRLKADKKWRCRCRLLTSFLGLVFFLLSVMAVSLLLTRGKRMFGSMV